MVANHFNSKGGDQPLFGRFQPPARSSEAQRHQQAQIVNDFVDAILAIDANANVIVLGDLNDFEFSQTLAIVKGGVLVNLIEGLPEAERYTYVFDGNSQALDHTLVSSALASLQIVYDVVHVNAEFLFDTRASDHDPQVALVCFAGPAPELSVTATPNVLWPPNHQMVTVNTALSNGATQPVLELVSVISNQPDNGTGDGDTPNDIEIASDQVINLRAERASGQGDRVYTLIYQVQDGCGNSTQLQTTVTVPANQGMGKSNSAAAAGVEAGEQSYRQFLPHVQQ